MSDKNKVAFIICSNDELMKDECIWYINRLSVPDDITVDIIVIDNATSMCGAYNLAMNSSDATYKVYLHHDVFILNTSFISDMITAFESDPQIGLLGVIGAKTAPANGSFYDHWDVGMIDTIGPNGQYSLKLDSVFENKVCNVAAVDGLCIMTSVDIPWREDVFDGFDFYDISQCIEMTRSGYIIGVVDQATPWCLHDSGYSKLGIYDKYRRKFCECYNDIFSFDAPYTLNDSEKAFADIAGKIVEKIDLLLKLYQHAPAYSIMAQLGNYLGTDRKLDGLYNTYRICECLQGASTLAGMGSSVNDILNSIKSLKFTLRRMKLGNQEATKLIHENLENGSLNDAAIEILSRL